MVLESEDWFALKSPRSRDWVVESKDHLASESAGFCLEYLHTLACLSDSEAMLGLPKFITFPWLISLFHLHFFGEFGLKDTKMSLAHLILINRTSLDTVHSCVLSLSHVITQLISLFSLSLWGNYLCPPNLNSDLPGSLSRVTRFKRERLVTRLMLS
jgi:hypothetical protein